MNHKNERLVELEGEVSKKENDIEDLETELNDLKSQITKLVLYIEWETLLRRTSKYLWDKIS